ncbi:2-dehydropantoate 2-reductase [soil metagenome]
MKKKHIVIIGLGGVGGYFGFKINQHNEHTSLNTISFVVRNQSFEIIKNNGLTLISSEHPNKTTFPNAIHLTIAQIQKPDLILVCVKEYDLENLCRQLNEVITDETIILPMMNGADIYDRIRKIIPNNTILPSCIYVVSHLKDNGVVEHRGKSGKLILGKDPNNSSINFNWVLEVLKSSNINYEFTKNIQLEIWTKFIFIASFGLVTAKYNSSIGTVCADAQQKEEVIKIMTEIKLIAASKEVVFENNIIEKTFIKALSFPYETPTSLQLDINSEKKNNELELFAGAIINYGRAQNVATPFTQKVYIELKNK